ncbi:MAG: asparagine synthase (glutamine-hydrolyzing) [Chitinophagaceae bacterium]
MCGILGQINVNWPGTSLPQLSRLSHRGPDGEGEWTNGNGNVYLGHTRLAILDPTLAGRQPMSDASQRFMLTFNGEIYNHLDLRPMMPSVRWRGTSDTETLIELFAHKGLEALPLLKGMFAFAIYDDTDHSVLLVRDRLGIKPLWFRSQEKTFSFASEVRALLRPDESVPDRQALSEYLGFGRMPGNGEIFNGMHAISPGGWTRLSGNGHIEKGCWWNGRLTSPKVQGRIECVQQVNQLVTTAIKEHLISDVGVGAFLSGGIDSSIVALVAGKELGKKLKTFTVGFPQGDYDERLIARRVADRAGSEHCELEIGEDACLSWVKEAVLCLDLPSVDAINTFIVSKAVRNTGLKVALSGLGGDELFGGYPSFKNVPWLNWLGALPINISRQLVNIMPQNLKDKFGGLTGFTTSELTVSRRRFTSVASLRGMGLGDGVPAIPKAPMDLDTMGKISWAEMQGYMIPMLLRDSDQMSMAVGLEIRVPFLDHRLVEGVLGFPQKYKKGRGVKPLLVDAFRADLPREVYDRPKQGFSLPMADWIHGPLAEFTSNGVTAAADLLGLSEPLRQRDLFKAGILHWTRVWNWSVLGHWLSKQKTVNEN